MGYSIKNWDKFQHYKKHNPEAQFPWIKLYRSILDDIEWHKLSGESSKALVMFWLIASETNGVLPSLDRLSFRLRLPEKQINGLLSTLSHWIYNDSIGTLEQVYINSDREERRREEKRGEETTPSASIPLPKPKKTKEPPDPHFQNVVKHIFDAYQKKKGSPLFLKPQDWPQLKGLISTYRAAGTMALYDLYLQSTDEWTVHKFHYSFPGFVHSLPGLVDNPNWKLRMKKYDLELNGSMPKLPEVVKTL